MADQRPLFPALRFTWWHFAEDGKYVNLLDTLDRLRARRACLDLTAGPLDQSLLAAPVLRQRLERLRRVVARLRRRGVSVELIGPSLTHLSPDHPGVRRAQAEWITALALLAPKVLWIDDGHGDHHRDFDRRRLLAWFRRAGRLARAAHPRSQLALMAASPLAYLALGTTAAQCAQVLAKPLRPLLAQTQHFAHDRDRAAILSVASTLALTAAQLDNADDPRLLGLLDCDQRHPSASLKSAASLGVQALLNLLLGFSPGLLSCLDFVGTAPYPDNPYLNLLQDSLPLWRSLARYLPARRRHLGIAVVAPPAARHWPRRPRAAALHVESWLHLLWRLGLPATCLGPTAVLQHDGPFVLAGTLAACLTRPQLLHLFRRGVLLDAGAADCLQRRGLGWLTGVKVGRAPHQVAMEILCDQTFAAPRLGYRTLLAGRPEARKFALLLPLHTQARPISLLARPDRQPNLPGQIAFDNAAHHRRCSVLPWSFSPAQADWLLCPERQRHFQDLFDWLARRPLPCFVEKGADLVPFLTPAGRSHTLLLALLNVGLDHVDEVRLRLGRLSRTIRRAYLLNRAGRPVPSPRLALHTCGDYQYLRLRSPCTPSAMGLTIVLLRA